MKYISLRLTRAVYLLPLFLCLICVLALPLKDYSLSALANTSSGAVISKKVVLDAGHGGFDGGSSAISGTPEMDINLSIALKTQSFLKVFGFDVVMTRENESALANNKKEDMYRRLEITKQNPNALFISIHQNHYSQEKYLGAQMFYGTQNKEESRALALTLQENFRNNLNPQNTRQVKEGNESLFLLKKCPLVSVMIECGFLSNKSESTLLENEEYQGKIAFTIAQSVTQYYALK